MTYSGLSGGFRLLGDSLSGGFRWSGGFRGGWFCGGFGGRVHLGARKGKGLELHLAKLIYIRSILKVYMHIHEEELIFSFLKTTVELISSNGLPLIICFLIFNFLFST